MQRKTRRSIRHGLNMQMFTHLARSGRLAASISAPAFASTKLQPDGAWRLPRVLRDKGHSEFIRAGGPDHDGLPLHLFDNVLERQMGAMSQRVIAQLDYHRRSVLIGNRERIHRPRPLR